VGTQPLSKTREIMTPDYRKHDPGPPTQQLNGQLHGAARSNGAPLAPRFQIESEADDRIYVGTGGKLIVPREDILGGIDPAEELEIVELPMIRKPGRREWIAIRHDAELTATLLINEPRPGTGEIEYFFVGPQLRAPIKDELKTVRVFPYFSFTTNRHALWIVKVTLENTWYESLQALLCRPHNFFEKRTVRIFSDKSKALYRVKHKLMPGPVTWLPRSTNELLGDALGEAHFILSADHPMYVGLVDGEELD
jgi:hypothetical protein